MGDLLEKLAGNGKTTALARVLIICFSIVGTILAPFITIFAKTAVNTFFEMRTDLRHTREDLTQLRVYMATTTAQSQVRDLRLNNLEADDRDHSQQLLGLDHRVTRLELSGGP